MYQLEHSPVASRAQTAVPSRACGDGRAIPASHHLTRDERGERSGGANEYSVLHHLVSRAP